MAALRIGTRGTTLALRQTSIVIDAAKSSGIEGAFDVVVIRSAGDDVGAPAWGTDTPGLFTTTLTQALVEGRIDAAVHSLKDLPVELTGTTTLAAILERADAADVLIDRRGRTLRQLPPGSRVGTSSLRRRAQILERRRDLEVVDIRGSVPSRISQVDRGDVDAIVIAGAGVERLGLTRRASERFDPRDWLPAPGQAAIAVEVRRDDHAAASAFLPLDDWSSRIATTMERSVLKAMMAGCHAPVGALAQAGTGERWDVVAAAWSADARRSARVEATRQIADAAEAEVFGVDVAAELTAKGGADLLQRREVSSRAR